MASTNRYEDSYNSRNYGGTSKSVLDLTKVPKGKEVVFFTPKEGTHTIDIVSYVIAGKNHPLVHARRYKAGELDYRLDVWTHRDIGPSKASVLCLKNSYGKACPICDLAEEARREGKKDEYKAFKAKRTVFYNIVDLDEPHKGVQLFQASHFLFEKELIEEAKNSTDDGSYVDFANEKDGYSIRFRGATASTGTTDFIEFKGFKFIKRTKSIEHLIEKTIPLDALLDVPTPEKVQKILDGEDDEDDDIPVTPPTSDPELDLIPETTTPVKLGATASATSWTQLEKDAVKPVAATAEKGVGVVTTAKSDSLCPSGYEFGTDCDKHPECDKGCPEWKACYKASRL